MKYREIFLLTLVIACSLVCNFTGIRWGLPGAERTDLVFPEHLRTDEFYALMRDTRDDIYRITEGSPCGYSKTNTQVSPIKQSLGIHNNTDSIVIGSDRRILANAIRPYLLKAHHADEQMTISALSNVKPKKLQFNPRLYHYGGVFIYSTGAWLGISHVLGLSRITPDLVFYLRNPAEMARIIVAGRTLGALAMTLSAVLVFLIGRRLYSTRAGFLASLFFALSPAVIAQAHIMKPYPMATFFALACVYASTFLDTKKTAVYLACGIAGGLTTGSIYTSWMILLVPYAFHLLHTRKLIDKNIVLTAITAIGIFVLTNFYWFSDFSATCFELSIGKDAYPFKFSLLSVLGFFKNTMIVALREGTTLLVILGTLYAFVKKEEQSIALLVPCIAVYSLYALMIWNASTSISTGRFLLPCLGILLIITGRAMDAMLANKRAAKIAIGFIAIAILHTGNYAASYIKNYADDSTTRSTQLQAGRWIMKEIPQGSSIGLFVAPEPYIVPPFDFSRYQVTIIGDLMALPQAQLPDYLIYVFTPDHMEYIKEHFEKTALFSPKNPLFTTLKEPEMVNANHSVAVFRKKQKTQHP